MSEFSTVLNLLKRANFTGLSNPDVRGRGSSLRHASVVTIVSGLVLTIRGVHHRMNSTSRRRL